MINRSSNIISAVVVLLMTISAATSTAQTAAEWLEKLDRQMFYNSAEYTATMMIHSPGGANRSFTMHGKVVGSEFALIEYLSPPRQKGTRYLKRGDNLWIYFPRQDRTMQIQGHMLRKGVQGGDMSFEDMTESSSLLEKYDVKILSESDSTVTLLLESQDMTLSYPFREILIDKKHALPVRIVLGGVNRTPIKEIITVETKSFKDRSYPVITEIRSMLVEDKWTRFELEDIRFGVEFPEDTFTKKTLEK